MVRTSIEVLFIEIHVSFAFEHSTGGFVGLVILLYYNYIVFIHWLVICTSIFVILYLQLCPILDNVKLLS